MVESKSLGSKMYCLLHQLRKKVIKTLPKLSNYEDVSVFRNYFTSDECEAVTRVGRKIALVEGRVTAPDDHSLVDARLRNVKSGTIRCSQETSWIFEKLESALHACNQERYKFKLTGFTEELQFLEYGVGDHYVWHKDFGRRSLSQRKLSATLQLTDPSEYRGGELELSTHQTPAPKEQGALIVFPAFLMHRVRPVISGRRYALVGWMNGPHFR